MNTLAIVNAVFQRDVIAYITYENIITGQKSECASKMTYKVFFELMKNLNVASFTISPTAEMRKSWANLLKRNGFDYYDIPALSKDGHKYCAYSK